MNRNKEEALKEIIEKIEKRKIVAGRQLELEKIRIAKKYFLGDLLKNAEIISFLQKRKKSVPRLLKMKPVRTLSGVANIAVMWLHGRSCPGKCIYCPDVEYRGKRVPKSYTGVEPTTMRAMRFNFSPSAQIKNRLMQLRITGHSTSKCELIIMGGTFMAAPKRFQVSFVKECLDALNESSSRSLEQSQKINERAKHRCVGLTIETRADFCRSSDIKQMLKLGCTRVELGIQSTDGNILKKIKRGHGTKENIEAIKRLKDAGMKVCVHFMPGLTGLTKLDLKKELRDFKKLFSPEYRPDELKIYPTLVVPGSGLHGLWKKGRYKPLTINQMVLLLGKMKKIIPTYVRVKRVMRDISEKEVVAGPKTTNLRQLVLEEMKRKGLSCQCIRCRQPWNEKAKNPELIKYIYNASGGKEIFLSFEDRKKNILVGFLRLRLDNENVAKVRELHVYGPLVPIKEQRKKAYQHKGLGKILLKTAESIARRAGKKKIRVTSGIGVRDYYRKKLGYKFDRTYMVKKL